MNVVDASGWLEYLANGSNADFFAPAIEATEALLVPTLSLYEVFKRVLQQRDEGVALQAVALMQQGRVIELSSALAFSVARLGVQHRIPMADSVILATARTHGAVLWTQDSNFSGIPDVRYRAKA